MSLNSLTNAATARRPDFYPFDAVPRGIEEIARAAATLPASTAAQAPSIAADAQPPNAINTALNVLFGYIPTEVLTLYVAILAAIQTRGQVTSGDWVTFCAFLGFTPVVVWLLYGAKLKAAQKPLPLNPRTWPLWEMFAATVAYSAWAFALPNSPFSQFQNWYSSGLAGMAVLVASTILGLLAPLFQRPLGV